MQTINKNNKMIDWETMEGEECVGGYDLSLIHILLSEERTIKSIIEYKKASENITRRFEQACEIEEEVE